MSTNFEKQNNSEVLKKWWYEEYLSKLKETKSLTSAQSSNLKEYLISSSNETTDTSDKLKWLKQKISQDWIKDNLDKISDDELLNLINLYSENTKLKLEELKEGLPNIDKFWDDPEQRDFEGLIGNRPISISNSTWIKENLIYSYKWAENTIRWIWKLWKDILLWLLRTPKDLIDLFK